MTNNRYMIVDLADLPAPEPVGRVRHEKRMHPVIRQPRGWRWQPVMERVTPDTEAYAIPTPMVKLVQYGR